MQSGGPEIGEGAETALGPAKRREEVARVIHAKARQAVEVTRKQLYVERKQRSERERGILRARAAPTDIISTTIMTMIKDISILIASLSYHHHY